MSQILAVGRTLMSPLLGSARWYNGVAEAHPFSTGVITTGLKTSAADIFAQKVIERQEHMDWTRHAVFVSFGFVYLGGFQYYLYNIKFPQWCGQITKTFGHKATAPIKTAIDQFVHHPLLYFPTFFAMKAAVSGKPLSTAVDKYRTEIWDSLKALWSVWVPAQLVNFAFVPRHLRVPYVAAVSFGWTVILSVMQGKFDKARQTPALPAAAAAVPVPKLPAAAAPQPALAAPLAAAAAQQAAAAAAVSAAAEAAAPQPHQTQQQGAQVLTLAGGSQGAAPFVATAVEPSRPAAASKKDS